MSTDHKAFLNLRPGPDLGQRATALAATTYAQAPLPCEYHTPPEPLPFTHAEFPAHWQRWAWAPSPASSASWRLRETAAVCSDDTRKLIWANLEPQMASAEVTRFLGERTAAYAAALPANAANGAADEARLDLLCWQWREGRPSTLLERLGRNVGNPAPVLQPDGTLRFPVTLRTGECPVCQVARAGVPPEFQRRSFETFDAATDELRANLAKVQEFAAAPAGFLFLLGRYGTGKTHLAVAALRAFGRGRYYRHLQIVEELRASYGRRPSADDDESIAFRCRNTPLLVLDEFGVAPGGNDAETLLYDILDHRMTHFRPTVLCGNVEAGQLESQFGGRLADRFRQAAFAVLNFTGPSRRKAGNADYLAQARLAANTAPSQPPKTHSTGFGALWPQERPREGRRTMRNLLAVEEQPMGMGLPSAHWRLPDLTLTPFRA